MVKEASKNNKSRQMNKKDGKGRLAKRQNGQKGARNATVARIRGNLDAGASAWLRLLSDPCNAPLVPGCYNGMASGMLYRTRTTVNPGPSAVDAYIYFHPSGNIGPEYCPLQWASTNTQGAAPSTAYGAKVFGLPDGSQVRCVAACMKVRYSGTELARQGEVGSSLTNDPPFIIGTTAGVAGTYPAAFQLLNSCQTLYRLGETKHEVRWVPANEDANFVETPITNFNTGNTVAFVVNDFTPGKVLFDLTAVWEVIPNVNGGLVPTERAPTSSNTLNDVLRAIGNVGQWATDPTNQQSIYNVARTAMGAGRLISYAAPALLMAP